MCHGSYISRLLPLVCTGLRQDTLSPSVQIACCVWLFVESRMTQDPFGSLFGQLTKRQMTDGIFTCLGDTEGAIDTSIQLYPTAWERMDVETLSITPRGRLQCSASDGCAPGCIWDTTLTGALVHCSRHGVGRLCSSLGPHAPTFSKASCQTQRQTTSSSTPHPRWKNQRSWTAKQGATSPPISGPPLAPFSGRAKTTLCPE